MRDYIILNNNDSRQLQGLIISTLPPISMPKQRVILEEIDGRDGDIITDLGYSAYDKEFEIGLSFNYNVDDIIKYFSDNKKGKAIFSNELDKYYKYEIYEQIDFNKLIRFKTATVKMHVQPFKYESDEEKIEINATEVTGEGSNITLNNTENGARFLDMKYKGIKTQTTYQGYNLCESKLPTTTQNGVTLTNNGDGTYKLNGTNTSSGTITFRINQGNGVADNLQNYEDGAYTLDLGVEIPNVQMCLTQNTTYTNFLVTGYGVRLKSGTLTSATNTFIYIAIRTGTTINNITIRPMLVKGTYTTSTMPNYEPYVGGSASPNPSYPQNIEIVTGNTNVKINNKNLIEDETFVQGAFNESVGTKRISCRNIKLKANTTYTFSSNLNYSTYNVALVTSTSQFPTSLIIYDSGWKTANFSFTTGNDDVYCNIAIKKVGELVISPSDVSAYHFQIEKGSTATSYVAHQEQNYEIDLPVENLFDGQLEVGNISWGADISDNNICRSTNYIEVKEKTDYIFSIDGIAHRVIVSMYDKDNNFIANSGETGKATTTGTFTTYTGTKYLRFRCYNGDKSLFENGNLQLELGTKANAYTPYGTTPIELCKIGDYQDYIYKNNGNWFIHKEIEKLILSDYTWTLANNTSISNVNTNRWFVAYPCSRITNNNMQVTMSNILPMGSANITYGQDVLSIGQSVSQLVIRMPVEYTTASSLNTALQNLGAYAYVLMNAPTETQITDENLIAQLEELWNATTYEEQTNILTSGDLEPIIYVKTYGMENPSYTIRNNGNTYAKPYITLYGLGVVGVYLNGYQIFNIDFGDSNSTQKINIDTENMEATNDNGLANRLVVGDYSNFKLNVGDNILSFTGTIQGFQISNYSRWL